MLACRLVMTNKKKDLYMNMDFENYMDGFRDFSQIVQKLGTICVEMSHATDIKSLKRMYDYDCDTLSIHAEWAIRKVKDNDFTKYFWLYGYNGDKYKIKQLAKLCREYNKEFRKIKRTYKKTEKRCAKVYGDVLQKLYQGTKTQDVISDNKSSNLILEKFKAETKIKEANATIAAAEATKAKLAIEQQKTEQLRLQAEERKEKEEQEILLVEERYRMMIDEFMNTVQHNVSGIVKQ